MNKSILNQFIENKEKIQKGFLEEVKGGSGSGNFGHIGRPGQIGGSGGSSTGSMYEEDNCLHQSVLKPLLSKRGFDFLGHSNSTIIAANLKFPKQDGKGLLKDIRSKGDKRNLRVYKSGESYRRQNTPEGQIHSMLYSDNKVQSFDVHGKKIKKENKNEE